MNKEMIDTLVLRAINPTTMEIMNAHTVHKLFS